MVRLRNKQGGFSLVELMVVVAIIGVLATIAIPRVNKFIAKARTSEAQTNLSSLYTFNKNFYVEYQGYTSGFTAMGFMPEGKLRYNTGFSGAAVVPLNYTTLRPTGVLGNTNSLVECPLDGSNARCQTLRGGTNAAPAAITAATVSADRSQFTAQSRAQLLAAPAAQDIWQINQDKNMANTSDGT